MEDWPLTGRLYGTTLKRMNDAAYRLHGTRCWICGKDGADTIDHVVALKDGGTNALSNLRPAHGRKSAGCVGNFARSSLKPKPATWVAPGW